MTLAILVVATLGGRWRRRARLWHLLLAKRGITFHRAFLTLRELKWLGIRYANDTG